MRHTLAARRALALVTAVACCIGSAACGAGGEPEPSPQQVLARAKANADAATSVHVRVTSRDVPPDAEGVLGVDGSGTHAPAFAGTLNARLKGVTADVDVIAVGGTVYVKLPFAPRHVATDPATYGAPDPASLLSPATGLTTLLTAVQNPVAGERVREGREVLRSFTGTVPGRVVRDLLHAGDPAQDFDLALELTDPDLVLRKVTVTGPFFTGSRSSYDLVFDRYGEAVDIRVPQ